MKTSQALATLLDGEYVSEMYGSDIHVSHLRIKPDVALIAALNNTRTGRPEGWMRVLWPVSHSKAAKAQNLAHRHGQQTFSRHLTPEILADWGSVAADPALCMHIAAWENTAPQRHIEHADILRYNPLRRVVVRDGQILTRIHASASPIVGDALEVIGQALPVPRVVSGGDNEHLTSVEFCGDGDIASLTASGVDGIHTLQAHTHAGELLACLHNATDMLSGDLSSALRERAPQPEAQAQAHARIFDVLDTPAAERLRHLSQRLRLLTQACETSSQNLVLSHGDASADQVLATADLQQMWLTDFDRVCLAPRAHDLGSYMATSQGEESAAFLRGYAAAGGELPSQECLRLGLANSLISRLAEPLKAGNLQWQSLLHQRLDDVEGILS